MDFVEQMLNDDEILSKYKAIDQDNHFPANHGMKHVFGVLDLSEKFGKLFKFSERELLILKTIEVLHDIGQFWGRKQHWLKSAEFARDYLPSKNIFSNEELEMIYSAISTHDEFLDYSKFTNKFSWFTAFIDKLDFSRHRMEDGYEEKFGYNNSSDIEKLEFSLKNDVFKIVIKTIENPKMIAPENLFNRNLICKAMTLFKGFSEHFGLMPKLFLEKEELDLNKFNKDAMIDR